MPARRLPNRSQCDYSRLNLDIGDSGWYSKNMLKQFFLAVVVSCLTLWLNTRIRQARSRRLNRNFINTSSREWQEWLNELETEFEVLTKAPEYTQEHQRYDLYDRVRNPDCDCCRLPSELQEKCGHWFCWLCIDRGHNKDCYICKAKTN